VIRVSWILGVTLAAVLCGGGAKAAGAQGVVDVNAHRIGVLPAAGLVVYQVDEIERAVRDSARAVGNSLVLRWSDGPSVSELPLAVGDTLFLRWEEKATPSTGFLFWGGRGGRGVLSIPPDAWNAYTTFRQGKKIERIERATLCGRFLLDGYALPTLTVRGGSEFAPARLLPFFRGGSSKPPKTIALRFARTKEELQRCQAGGVTVLPDTEK
jgi:hypothetical protein